MQWVNTQVSATNISTTYITSLRNNTDTGGVATFPLRMSDILLHTVFARYKLLTTAGQSLSVAKITRPRYFKEVTISRGHPYVLKALAVTSLSSSVMNLRLLLFVPQVHCSMRLCVPFRDFHGTSMSRGGD